MNVRFVILLVYLVKLSLGQRKVVGDIKEQRISLTAGVDEREERVFRRPPTYLIIASRVVRPNTIYQVIVSLLEESPPARVHAALTRDGVEVFGDHVNLQPLESKPILLQVPPGNNIDSVYRLRIEGSVLGGGAVVFENETILEFSRQFLAISIYTNQAVYNGGQDVRIRAVMLDTGIQPYTDIADLFIIDPDGFVIRKWNSKQINNGILSGVFWLPEFPKVGFWTVRVETQGQREDLRIKVEKYYLPKFEVYVRMPPFILETENVISVNVLGLYLFEKLVKGDVLVRWYAKISDGFYPLYQDSVQYRSQYAHHQNRYKNRNISDEQVSNLTLSDPERYGTLDSSFSPNIEATPVNKWTYISSEQRYFHHKTDTNEDFYLQIADIKRQMGTLTNIQIRAEAFITEYYYNSTQRGFCDSKLINPTLNLKFLGSEPMVFKPGMLFEGTVSITHSDYVPLSKDDLKESSLNINIRAKKQDGTVENLPSIFIPKSLTSDFSTFQDIDWLTHYGQLFGSKAAVDTEKNINPAAFFTDNVDKNTEFIFYEIYAREKSFEEFRNTGVHRFRFKVPKLTEELYLSATYSDSISSRDTFAEITVYGAYGPKDKFIHVRSSTKNISVGHYVVFHVQSNFPLPSFNWIIVSKNILVASGREYGSDIHPAVTTFSLVVSSEMAPGFHIMVYSVFKPDDYLLSDSAYYPVNTFNRHKIEFKLNQVKDHSKNTVEAIFMGDPGAVFLTSVTRTFLYSSQGKNSITETSILESLHTFEQSQRHIHKLYTTDRDALYLDKVTFYPSMDYGVDAKRTFESKDILVFTDYVFIPQTPSTRQCNISLGMFPCLHKGCYTEAQICNGQKDCEDGLDESQCKEEFLELQNDNLGFKLSRFNRFTDYFESGVDIWGWFDINMDEDREQFNTIEVPLITDSWFFSAFSISKTNGIGIIDPLEYDTIRPIHFVCEAPSKVHRGESVGIRCIVMNRSPEDLECLLTLKGSDDYEFIHVEEFGYVTSYSPRTSKGDHQHLVYVRGENEVDVHFPIKPVLSSDQGFISVDLSISTQIMSLSQIVSIEIIPEGSIVHRHTSVLLDLKSRAFELEFMNIIVDESPIIPYEIYRRYIFGSPYGKFSLSGDVIGPTFIDGNPVSLESLFPDGNGRFGKGTEYHTFNLASNSWQLHYFRLTNQLQSNWELTKSVFEQMNVEYAAVMRRYSSQGWVSNWDAAKPSVWLTAWSIRIFETISFQDWEDYIYVDPEIFQSSVLWLINYQNKNGAFFETEFYTNPLHKAMACKIGQGNKTIALTSHVLISLQVTADKIQGETKKYVSHARKRAVHYLEKNLPMIEDPYDLAITAYALALSRSAEADAAYGKLMKMKRIESGMVYWSPTKIETHRVRYEFNRPFLEAKSKQPNDALAVEATGYALLTLFLVEGGGVTILQDQIVEWLNTMRLGVGGFIATVDTIIALEALVTYSYNSRIKDLTDLNIKIDIPDSNITHFIKINGDEVSRLQTFDIPNVWGHINMYATGAGQAVAQMDINYGIDYEPFKDTPPEDCFKLSIYESFRGRNKSEIDVRSCFSWTCTNESENSGMAMLVVDIPTGYIMLQPDANKLVRSGIIPTLKDADVEKPGKTIWYFEYITASSQCFTHSIRRYFPMANLTRTRQAVIIEPLRPEKFHVTTFNATSLYILSICEVCGSYQCPYCPFYSSSNPLILHPIISFITCIFSLLKI